jgi:hypothetical protein
MAETTPKSLQDAYDVVCAELNKRFADGDSFCGDVMCVMTAMKFGWKPFQAKNVTWEEFENLMSELAPGIMARAREQRAQFN